MEKRRWYQIDLCKCLIAASFILTLEFLYLGVFTGNVPRYTLAHEISDWFNRSLGREKPLWTHAHAPAKPPRASR